MVTSENGVMWISRPQEKTVLMDWQPSWLQFQDLICSEKISEWCEVPLNFSLVNILLVCITTFVYNDKIYIPATKAYENAERIYTLGDSSERKLDSYGAVTLKKTRKNRWNKNGEISFTKQYYSGRKNHCKGRERWRWPNYSFG